MSLTVSQLAERLLPVAPSGDLEGLIRQIRHWTLSGVIKPAGDIHTGAGRHRRYEQNECYFAALALELTRWRIPVGVSDLVVQVARKEFYEQDLAPTALPLNAIKDAIAGRADMFVMVKMSEGIGGSWPEILTGQFDELVKTIKTRGWANNPPSFVSINLSALFGKVRSDP